MNDQRRRYKVKHKLNSGGWLYRSYEEYAEGDNVIGKVADFHIDQYKKKCPVIEVEECYFEKDSEKYIGKKLCLNHCGSMANGLAKLEELTGEELNIGDILSLTYAGMAVVTKGAFKGQDCHVVELDILSEEEEEENDYSGL